MELTTLCTAVFVGFLTLYFLRGRRKAPFGYKDVPVVRGEYPIVGHGLAFSKDIVGFIRNAVREYDQIEDQISNGLATELLGLFNNAGSYKDIYQQDRELKKFDRKLYDTMRKKKGVHSPFKLQG